MMNLKNTRYQYLSIIRDIMGGSLSLRQAVENSEDRSETSGLSFDKVRNLLGEYVKFLEEAPMGIHGDLFLKAVEMSSDAIGFSTPDGVHFYQNASFDRLFGEIGDDPPSTLYVIEDKGREIFEAIMSGGEWTGEIEMYGKNKERLFVLLRAYSLKNNKGDVIGLVGVHTDITENIKYQARLKDQQLMLDTVIREVPVGIVVSNAHGDILLVNNTFTEITGYVLSEVSTVEQWMGKAYPDAFYRKQVAVQWEKAVIERDGSIKEFKVYCKDGSHKMIEFRSVFLEDGRGIVLLQDITESYKTFETLKDSERRFRKLFEDSADATLLIENNEFIDCNKAALAMLRMDNDSQLFKTHPSVLSPEYQPDGELSREKAEKMIRMAQTYGSHRFEWIHKRSDGENFVAEVLLTRIEYLNRNILHCVWRDISKRKQMESELVETRNTLQSIVDSMPSIIAGVDENTCINFWNSQAESYTGLKASEVIGKQISQVFRNMKTILPLIQDSLEKKQINTITRQVPGVENNIDYQEVTIFPFMVRESTGAVVRIDDISERLEMENKLAHSQKMETVGRLAGGIAHDFNNMLTGILSASELLSLKLKDTDNMRSVNVIMEAANKASDLTGKLLDFSRLDSQPFEVVDVNELIYQTADILRHTLHRNIELDIVLNAERTKVKGSSSQLQSIFMNLAVNAADAMPGGGRIEFYSVNPDLGEKRFVKDPDFDFNRDYLLLKVTDSGNGIPDDIREKIFDPFFTTKERGKGTGLGLSSVLGIVKIHQGCVFLDSSKGEGSVFHIYLPTTDEVQEIKIRESENAIGNARILVIDDEEMVRETTCEILENYGFSVFSAGNGKEGVEEYSKNTQIDLVILDMIMPVMDGLECYKELKKVDPEVNVLVVTGFSKSAMLRELKESGVSGFMSKPFKASELIEKVNAIVKE